MLVSKAIWSVPLYSASVFLASLSFILCFKDSINLFLERGESREKEGEKHQCAVASCTSPIRDLARNPDMCPDWESNQRPFTLQSGT